MVAAWIRADTGVGPSMASGNQMCKGNIADLPAPPMKIRMRPQVITESPIKDVEAQFAMALPSGSTRVTKSKEPP